MIKVFTGSGKKLYKLFFEYIVSKSDCLQFSIVIISKKVKNRKF